MKKIIAAHIIVWLVFLAYLTLLTVLLLSPRPAEVLGLKRVPWFLGDDIGMHLCAFCALAIFCHSTYWPNPLRWAIVLLLLGYGATTETLQLWVPNRSCELKDYIDNFLGVLAGSGIYWLVQRFWSKRMARNDKSPSK